MEVINGRQVDPECYQCSYGLQTKKRQALLRGRTQLVSETQVDLSLHCYNRHRAVNVPVSIVGTRGAHLKECVFMERGRDCVIYVCEVVHALRARQHFDMNHSH